MWSIWDLSDDLNETGEDEGEALNITGRNVERQSEHWNFNKNECASEVTVFRDQVISEQKIQLMNLIQPAPTNEPFSLSYHNHLVKIKVCHVFS